MPTITYTVKERKAIERAHAALLRAAEAIDKLPPNIQRFHALVPRASVAVVEVPVTLTGLATGMMDAVTLLNVEASR